MPTLPSGRTLGLATTYHYVDVVRAIQGDPVTRAVLEEVERPEELFHFLTVMEKTADGRDERIGLSVQQFLDGGGDFSDADRAAYREWLQLPHVRARLQQDVDELREALAQIPFELTGEAAEVFPEEHAPEAMVMLVKHVMAERERGGNREGDPQADGAPPNPPASPPGSGRVH